MNNVIETSYLALELTKLYFNGKTEKYTATKYSNIYKEILCNLLDIEKLPDVEAIELENTILKDKLKLKEPIGLTKSAVDELLYLIEDNRGDMEPLVYSHLTDYIRTHIQ